MGCGDSGRDETGGWRERMCALPLTPLFSFSYCWITALRILRSTEPNSEPDGEREKRVGSTHKSTTSRYGFKLDASRNLWEGSGLKVDSAVTDVGWGVGGGLYSSLPLSFHLCFVILYLQKSNSFHILGSMRAN